GALTSFGNPKLWYVNSPDFGKTWGIPRKICGTPTGKAAWAHSEIIDKNGALHAVWRDNRNGAWQLYYNKSEDGGKTWLASDFCIGNEDSSITLDNLYYQTGSALSDWLKYGSDKFVQIAVSNENRVYVVFSSNSSSHYIRYSDDGGRTWPQKNKVSFAKTSGSSKELIESVNYIEPMKKLMLVFITGSDLKSRKMKYCDPDGKNFELNSNFNIAGVAESSPPALNDEYKFTYIKTGIESQGDATYEYFRIDKIFSFPSYSQFDETKLLPSKQDMTARALYKNISFNNKSYVFYHTNIFSEPPNFIFFNYSSDGGNSYSDPVNFDSANNEFDKLTCAVYSGVPYLAKRNANAAPAADFFVSSFDKQILFSACNGSLFYSGIGDNEVKKAEKYNFTSDKITCFSGDGDGNLIYGTSNGAYFRNINFGSATYFTTGARADKVNFPISDYYWHHFFNGVSVKTVFAEKNGVLWVGTANKGIYRSNDYGENWKNIEAVKSNINGSINFIGMGNANRINKLIFFSSRYNLKNADDITSVVPEHLCSTYNLSNNCIESTTLITRGQYQNIISAATNSYDNDKIIRFDGLEKKISIKKHNFTAINAVYTKNSSIDNYQQWGNSNLTPAGMKVTTADTIEILAGRKYCVHPGEPYCFFSLPGGFWYQGPSNLSGQLKYNIVNSDFDCLQYFYGNPAKSGELKYAINTSLTPRTQGYCLVKTVLHSQPLAEINVSSKMNANVNNAFAAPDNKTIFFTNYVNGKVYSVSDINDTSAVQVKEYSENNA
ncbi:MAG TPA: sialidase family protein, partial [Candidatus Wallbacteria bacterium]|nr:sialidase family protein [Candidatus Wallbacteria bacterium]